MECGWSIFCTSASLIEESEYYLWETIFAYRQVTSVLLLGFYLHNLKITSKISAHESPPTGKKRPLHGTMLCTPKQSVRATVFHNLFKIPRETYLNTHPAEDTFHTFWQKCDKGRKDWRSHNSCEFFMVHPDHQTLPGRKEDKVKSRCSGLQKQDNCIFMIFSMNSMWGLHSCTYGPSQSGFAPVESQFQNWHSQHISHFLCL